MPHAEGVTYVWKIVVRENPYEADCRQGWALAGSIGEALEMAGEPEAIATPQV
ncbi:MAG: hypothetical protein AAF636_15405 [Pseudomonadota bacterium]